MSYDLYAELAGSNKNDVDAIVNGKLRDIEVRDVAARIRLLTATAAHNDSLKEYAVSGGGKKGGGYKSLVHARKPNEPSYAKELIQNALKSLGRIGLLKPSVEFSHLPAGSWFLQFDFTLAKPWMSKDDAPFYVAESVNPVRKDKVFKGPMMAASGWKGLLRWTAMKIDLIGSILSDEEFAARRAAHSVLFGDEKGQEPEGTREFAKFLDEKCPGAKDLFRRKVREYFPSPADQGMPHHRGRIHCYPTFFNSIDVEVINPHSRKTRAGTQPIYLECVPAGAKGTFSLLYCPFDLIGRKGAEEVKREAEADLQLIAEAIKAMMLTYGFSAKRTSGYGAAKDKLSDGKVSTRLSQWPLSSVSALPQEVSGVQF